MQKRKRVKIFEDLKAALRDAQRHELGQRVNLRVSALPPPPRRFTPAEIRQIRLSLNASQVLFAQFLNVSANTVESWEQGARRPRHAALKLLNLARKNPQVLLQA